MRDRIDFYICDRYTWDNKTFMHIKAGANDSCKTYPLPSKA